MYGRHGRRITDTTAEGPLDYQQQGKRCTAGYQIDPAPKAPQRYCRGRRREDDRDLGTRMPVWMNLPS